MRALMRWAAGRIPASCNEIVKGELAVFDDLPNNLSSFHGMSIPIKKIVPKYTSVMLLSSVSIWTYQRRRSGYAKRPA
jgi:hypothetical protein